MRVWMLFLTVVLFACESDQAKKNSFLKLGNEALERGAFKEAIEHYDNALKVDPSFVDALNNRGVAQLESGHPYDAILDYNRALAIDPAYDECRLNRSYAFEFIGQYSNALKDVDWLVEQAPDSAFLHFYKGLVLTKMRRYPDALQAMTLANSMGMNGTETLVNLATLHYFLNNPDSANHYLQRVFEINPKDPNALNTQSQLLLSQNELNGALYAIERAIEVVPNEPYFLNNRGLVLLEMDSLAAGLRDINQSILLNPDNGWAYRNKGIYHFKKKEYRRAAELFQGAEASNEFIDELYYYWGLSLYESGQLIDACEQWLKGEELGEQRSKAMRSKCR